MQRNLKQYNYNQGYNHNHNHNQVIELNDFTDVIFDAKNLIQFTKNDSVYLPKNIGETYSIFVKL